MADQTADFLANILQHIDARYEAPQTPHPSAPRRKKRPKTPLEQLTHEIDGWEHLEHLLTALSTMMTDDLPRLERETAALHREREALVRWLNNNVGTSQASLDVFGANLRRYGRLMIRLKIMALALEQARARKQEDITLPDHLFVHLMDHFQ